MLMQVSKLLAQVTGESYWLKLLAQVTGASYWRKLMAQVTGTSYWRKLLAQATGASYWRKLLAQVTGTECFACCKLLVHLHRINKNLFFLVIDRLFMTINWD